MPRELARVERIGRDLANARRLGEIGAVERASQAIRHYIDRVRTATPGYGGLFGERDIDGVALDQLRLFDEGLLIGVDELRPAIDRLEAGCRRWTATRPGGRRCSQDDRDRSSLGSTRRQEVIETGRAASRDSVLAALQPLAEVIPARGLLRTTRGRDLDPGRRLSRRCQDRRRRPAAIVPALPHRARSGRVALRQPRSGQSDVPHDAGRRRPSEARHSGTNLRQAAVDRRRRSHRRARVERIARGAVRSASTTRTIRRIRAHPRLGRRATGVRRPPHRAARFEVFRRAEAAG